MSVPDLRNPLRIHVIGIGGAGMSAIALVLVAMGHTVSGSDLKDGRLLDRLRGLGIRIVIGHDRANVDGAEMVTISSAVPETNIELRAARELALAIHTRAETLTAISAMRSTVSVSGTHGKTTTASMLALSLVQAGLDPSFIIGGEVNEIGTNAVWDSGKWLVVEADESDGTFLELASAVAVVTNIEADHIDYYGSFGALVEAFQRFVDSASLGTVVCADDPVATRIGSSSALSYGFSPSAALHITDFAGGRSNISFRLSHHGKDLGEFQLPVPGVLNARNACAAIAASLFLEVPIDETRHALSRFAGVARRFEFRGERGGITYVDDYAHLPGEVEATLAAARRGGWGRIVCVFQPHRYSRVAMLAGDFADAFVDADLVVVTDIYAAGEAPLPGVSAKLILDAVLGAHPTTRSAYVPEHTDLVSYLRETLRPGDCCLTLGAGDITALPHELLRETKW